MFSHNPMARAGADDNPTRALDASDRESRMQTQDLKKAGLKATLPRIRILGILEHSDKRHMSAEDVFKALLDAGEEVGLATVYRVLTQFEAAGLVARHHFEGGHSVFELDHGDHHDHIVCNQCGRVEEFLSPAIEELQNQVAQEKGFAIRDHSLIIYGECLDPECPNREPR